MSVVSRAAVFNRQHGLVGEPTAPIVPPTRALTLEEENPQLRRENERLREERESLIKATAFFARDTR